MTQIDSDFYYPFYGLPRRATCNLRIERTYLYSDNRYIHILRFIISTTVLRLSFAVRSWQFAVYGLAVR